MKKNLIFFIISTPLILSSCSLFNKQKKEVVEKQVSSVPVQQNDLKKIRENKELRVVVDYNSTNYFVYKGQPMGFQYELLKELANDLNVELTVFVSNNLTETFAGLNSGQFDLVAKNLTVTKERSNVVDFTKPIVLSRQVLVQRKPEGWDSLGRRQIDRKMVREQLDLAGKEVYVQENTVFYKRLLNLSDEIGESINIVQDTVYGVEQLIALVASGDIDYTVCDEIVGLVNQKYYPNIDVRTPVSFNQKLSWALRKNSPQWKGYLDDWIEDFKNTTEYRIIYKKYFSGYRSSNRIRSDFHSISGGGISEYDDLIKEISNSFGWDWRLIAAIIMQESAFDTNAESWVGATGLMQLMPETAELYEAYDLLDPRENIRAGLEHLVWLDNTLEPLVPDSSERVKFVLASYNVGIGHVMDARKLAMKYGKNPEIWKDNVDFFIRKKSLAKYYNDPVVRWGYCRGEEPYNYVIKILDTYSHYLNVLPNANNVALVSLPVLQSSLR